MKILGVTQGGGIRLFLRLAEMLDVAMSKVQVAAYVADSLEFKAIARSEPHLLDGSLELLREWDITAAGLRRVPDWAALRRHEEVLGDPVLWNALLADRRLFFGKKCKYRQDYLPRFSHAQLGSILLEAIEAIRAFVDRVRPDVILAFGTATFGDYLFYRIAKSRGIPYLLLKSTKIANYVSLNDDAIKLSSHVAALYERPEELPKFAMRDAAKHIERIRSRGLKYEGALKNSSQFRPLKGLTALARGVARDFLSASDPEIRTDNHVDKATMHAWYTHFGQPLRAAYIRHHMGSRWVGALDIASQPPFVFFPLHFEPEVSIQVFGRPFQNQIELVRNLALSLPAGMVVLVKEHPRSVGFRPLGYYRKLLEIPNVVLADPQLQTHALIRHAELVAVISGSTGLEAAICGKPVLTFGIPTYNALPESMLRHVSDLHSLSRTLRDLLENYRINETALQSFVAAQVAGAVPVDLYSVLLGKAGRHSEGRENVPEANRREQDYRTLSEYCMQRISSELARTIQHEA